MAESDLGLCPLCRAPIVDKPHACAKANPPAPSEAVATVRDKIATIAWPRPSEQEIAGAEYTAWVYQRYATGRGSLSRWALYLESALAEAKAQLYANTRLYSDESGESRESCLGCGQTLDEEQHKHSDCVAALKALLNEPCPGCHHHQERIAELEAQLAAKSDEAEALRVLCNIRADGERDD